MGGEEKERVARYLLLVKLTVTVIFTGTALPSTMVGS